VIGVVEEAHKGPIFGLAFHEEVGLFTGGKDGVIALRDAKLQVIDSVLVESGVRAMDVDEKGSLVVGMEDSVILEIHGLGRGKEHTQNKVLEAHSSSKNEELRGLAVSPVSDSEFATAGDDCKVIVWCMDKRRSICQTTLNKKIRAITYSPDGTVLAVGSEDGDIYILQSDTLAQVFVKMYTKREGIHTSKHGICVLKFSPNGQYLAVGSYDRVLDIYDVPAGIKLISCGIGHTSYVSHLDWSTDSSFIQTNSANFDVMFWDVEGQQIPADNAELSECVWASQSCILGPSVSGIWDKGVDGTDINWCDRNPDSSCLASGDDFLYVRLYSYPANKESMECKKYMGHGSFVSKVMFNKNGTRLISCGGNDGLALQWIVKCE
jgi:WD40 repeat protein